MNINLDKELKSIDGLKWLPWIGQQYDSLDQNNKILIVGETHYHDEDEPSRLKHEDINFTRLAVDDFGIHRNRYNKINMYSNLHRALFGSSEFDSNKFWNTVCFYNFIQRPMITNKMRPTPTEFSFGWKIFFEVIKVLKPKTCLMLGITSSHRLAEALQNSEFSMVGPGKWYEKISGVEPIILTLTDNAGYEVKLIFIRHTSLRFSWSKWNNFLSSNSSDLIELLKEKSK
jgi:hypothetical protein